MKLTYDAKYNVAYIKLHEKTDEVTTIKISDEINIDIGSDGTAYGIELLNANDQLGEDQGNLILELGGRRQEVALGSTNQPTP